MLSFATAECLIDDDKCAASAGLFDAHVAAATSSLQRAGYAYWHYCRAAGFFISTYLISRFILRSSRRY